MNTMLNDELAIRTLHEEVIASINALNLEKLLSLHADDIILMEPGMPIITGKEEVRKMFYRFQRNNIRLQLSFNIQEIEVFGERAFVRGQVRKTVVQNGDDPCQEKGKFISLAKKQQDGSWLRTHVIVNSDVPVNELYAAKQQLQVRPHPKPLSAGEG